VQNFSRIREALNRNKADFLKTDLDTALTFVDIASQAGLNLGKKLRNQANARRAYDTVLRFLKHATLNAEEDREIYDRLSRLKLALEKLGEVFEELPEGHAHR
jgi:hypothetical protein